MLKNIITFGICLGLICAVSGGTLSFVYKYTMPKIMENERLEKERLIKEKGAKEIFPNADKFEDRKIDNKEFQIEYKNGKAIGLVVKTIGSGFGGEIEIAYGINYQGVITGFTVLSHNETPTIGGKAIREDLPKQIKDIKIENFYLQSENPEKGKIDGVTGATITTLGILNGIRDSINEINYKKLLEKAK